MAIGTGSFQVFSSMAIGDCSKHPFVPVPSCMTVDSRDDVHDSPGSAVVCWG